MTDDWIALLKELRHKVIAGLDDCLATEKQSGLEEGRKMAMICVRYMYIYPSSLEFPRGCVAFLIVDTHMLLLHDRRLANK